MGRFIVLSVFLWMIYSIFRHLSGQSGKHSRQEEIDAAYRRGFQDGSTQQHKQLK